MGIADTVKKIWGLTYRNLEYTVAASSIAGLGNGIAGDNFKDGFGQGYVNHFPLSFIVCYGYPIAVNYLSQSEHYRFYTNLVHAFLTSGMITYHYFAGTDNPLEAVIPTSIALCAMLNINISKKNLEKKTA